LFISILIKKTKGKQSENNKPSQKRVICQYGELSVGRPSDYLLYNRPPVIAQVIPAMGGDTNALMPQNNKSIQTIFRAIKDKTNETIEYSRAISLPPLILKMI
jgi:hypothetical protein